MAAHPPAGRIRVSRVVKVIEPHGAYRPQGSDRAADRRRSRGSSTVPLTASFETTYWVLNCAFVRSVLRLLSGLSGRYDPHLTVTCLTMLHAECTAGLVAASRVTTEAQTV